MTGAPAAFDPPQFALNDAALEQLKSRFESDWIRSKPAPPPSSLALWMHDKYESMTQ